MSAKRTNGKRRRSRAVPLTIVPTLAALVGTASCSHPTYDPCQQDYYVQSACDVAIANHGYWNSGVWYPRVYPYASVYYLSHYNSFVAGGGRIRSLSPTTFSPGSPSAARASVVRGGFGGIGSGHASAGS